MTAVDVWVADLVEPAGRTSGALLAVDAGGRITARTTTPTPPTGATRLGTASAGFGNAHSHCFHRALRGRTHDDGGDFWSWREQMYRVAGSLDPDSYRAVATAAFAEMVQAGYTAVGEFHYVHHRPDGTPYPGHEMELALADAARATGIRLVLLDTCYLAAGIGLPLAPEQRRFGDGDAHRWLDRWTALCEALADHPEVRLGAAVHSVRAVPVAALELIAEQLPVDIPLHVHLSEQPAENEQSLAAYGRTPTRVLADAGLLGPRLTAVHATHVTATDIELLGGAGAGVALCPTTEADLADGIGPARELVDAGATLSIGSDQNAVVDPLLELRAVEHGERLRSGRRGRFRPAELWAAGTAGGYRALGLTTGGTLGVGDPADLVEFDTASPRTAGCRPEQLPLVATSADVRQVLVGGRPVPRVDPVAALARAGVPE